MKKPFLAAALGLAVVVAGYAGEDTNALPTTITIGKVTYEDVRWGAVTPATVTFFHKTGIATIPLENLRTDLQQRFGYDSQKAAAYRKAQAEQVELARRQQEQDRQEAKKRSESIAAAIQQRQEELQRQEEHRQEEAQRQRSQSNLSESTRLWVGTVNEVFSNGVTIYGYMAPRKGESLPSETYTIFLVNHPEQDKLAEGVRIGFHAYRDGNEKFEYSNGNSRILEKWVCIRALPLHH